MAICQFKRATLNFINFPNNGQTGLESLNELLKGLEDFRFSTTEYCTVELAPVAKLTQYVLKEGEVFFFRTAYTRTY